MNGSDDAQTIEHVWCFEGAGGDSTWPAGPVGNTWGHWSKFDPPGTPSSKWHLSQMDSDASTWNAWCGCDSLEGAPGYSNNDEACSDVFFWNRKKGYGNDWHYALELRADSAPNASGATIEFDVRYDIECNYDYLYVEYSTDAGTSWSFLRDSYPSGKPAVFNSVSGNPCLTEGGTGRCCGTDYFESSDQFDPGGGNIVWHGHSDWVLNVDFPIPANATGGVRVRWRAFTDGAWSDEDGNGDTDGHSAIDNVLLTIASGGTTAADDFETGTSDPFLGRSVPGETIPGPVQWFPGGLIGNTYDGWHLEFDPKYSNKGNTCTFSDDWMWAAKPAGGPIPPSGNGFDFFLVSPSIPCAGWNGGVVEYSEYVCMPPATEDFADQLVRVYDTNQGWSPWNDFDAFHLLGGCSFWTMDNRQDLSPFLGATIESVQVAWEVVDANKPGDFEWGKHNMVQYLIDNVSFGSFDATGTVFTARSIEMFADTFSLSDPAHTAFLANSEQGIWSGHGGPSGVRDFANADSLTVQIEDSDGVSASNVDLWWRHDDGGSGSFGAFAKVDMSFAVPDPLSATDEGTYRAIIGKDDGGVEDVSGTAGDRLIWKAGTTVHYYVSVVDDAVNTAVWPNTADDPDPAYHEFSVLPLGNTTPAGQRILLVDGAGIETLDFESSNGFDPDGGAGFGGFTDPAFDAVDRQYAEALALLFGGSIADPRWDTYHVPGVNSSVQVEPNGFTKPALDVGGYMTESGDPMYDVLIWPLAYFAELAFADATRLELATYLDAGGRLLVSGDEVAFALGSGGNGIDPAFLGDYLGTSFPSPTDDTTEDRVLNMTGEMGTSLEGVEIGIYGECPFRRSFDRLTLAAAAPGSQNHVLATYTDGGASDNGRACSIANVRQGDDAVFGTADDGVAVLYGFDLTALLSDRSRACAIGLVLAEDMGIVIPAGNLSQCDSPTGVEPPPVLSSFRFSLANGTPNPFASATSIRFSIATRERVRIDVVDVLGRRVRTLADETMDAGVHVRDWNGRAESGAPVSNGVYFVTMSAGGFEATRKLVMLK